MINRYIVIFLLLSISSLANAQIEFDANKINQTVYDTTLDNDILLGKFDLEGLRNAKVFKRSFKESRDYKVNTELFAKDDIDGLKDYNITIVMGSWCSDSQYNVPKIIMILEALNYPSQKLSIICVNRFKKVPEMDISKLNINFVPTCIFYKNGEEKGRIVENPKESFEADIINILNK